MTVQDFRFDALVRTERYFTATLLPVFFFHDNFAGLQRFLECVGERVRKPRNAHGTQLRDDVPIPPLDRDRVEVITEFFITRDLKAAGKLRLRRKETADDFDPDNPPPRDRLSAPDVVIVVGNQLVVCEGKFFGTCNLNTLNQQLKWQRIQIELLFTARPSLKAYRHVAILPFRFSPSEPDCDVTFTWKDIADLAIEVLGPTHYITHRLAAAVAYYASLDSGSTDGAARIGGQVPLDAALDMCCAAPQSTWIGFTGGAAALASTERSKLLARPWKWRDPSKHAGKIIADNWIRGDAFVVLIDAVLAGRRQPDPPAAPLRYARLQVTLDEAVELCRNAKSPLLIGYSEGRAAFQNATLADLEKRKLWKWRDPAVHTARVSPRNWIPCDVFLKHIRQFGST